MKTDDCIFCKIIAKEVPATIIKESDDLLVIKDISPKAPIHYLIIPKKHIKNIQSFNKQDMPLASDMFAMAKELANELPKNGDFKFVINSGHEAGQRVYHVHAHFLSGKNLPEL